MMLDVARTDVHSRPLIRHTSFEIALKKQHAINHADRIMYLKSLYLRNLLMFIEEELGLKQGFAHYTTFIGSYHKIQTQNLLACCDGDEDLFDFVSHMESRLLRLAKERMDKIYRMRKFLFFLPIFGWVQIARGRSEFVIGQYNRSIVSTLQIKKELESHGIDSKEILLDIASHNTCSYKIYDWVNWD